MMFGAASTLPPSVGLSQSQFVQDAFQYAMQPMVFPKDYPGQQNNYNSSSFSSWRNAQPYNLVIPPLATASQTGYVSTPGPGCGSQISLVVSQPQPPVLQAQGSSSQYSNWNWNHRQLPLHAPVPSATFAFSGLNNYSVNTHEYNTANGGYNSHNSSSSSNYPVPVVGNTGFDGVHEEYSHSFNEQSGRSESSKIRSSYTCSTVVHCQDRPKGRSSVARGLVHCNEKSAEAHFRYGSYQNESLTGGSYSVARTTTTSSALNYEVRNGLSNQYCECRGACVCEAMRRNGNLGPLEYFSYVNGSRVVSSWDTSESQVQKVSRKRSSTEVTNFEAEDRGYSSPRRKQQKIDHSSATMLDVVSVPRELNPKAPEKLYHYTTEEGAFGILKDKYIGMKGFYFKRFGIGVYFTDLPPERSSGDISFSNYRSTAKDKLLRTEFCFEFLSSDIPKLELCREEDRPFFWKAAVHLIYLEKNGTYYCRKLSGAGLPLSVVPFKIEF